MFFKIIVVYIIEALADLTVCRSPTELKAFQPRSATNLSVAEMF